jgi:hypothetical protein
MARLPTEHIRYPRWGARSFNPFTSAILLYGFEVGKHKLMPEHKDALDQYAALVRRQTSPTLNFAVAVKGNASRTGSDSVNMTISANRAAAVADYLSARIGSIAGLSALPSGENLAREDGLPDGFESEQHRSVVIGATDYPKHAPPPPPPVLKKVVIPPGHRDRRLPLKGLYTIKVLAGWEAGAGIPYAGAQLTRFKVEVRDLSRHEYRRYFLTIGSAKLELGPPANIESVGPGEPRHFMVEEDVRVFDFEGKFDFTAIAADFFDKSAAYGHVSMRRNLGDNVGISDGRLAIINFQLPTGSQRWEFGKVGLSASSGIGYMSPAAR